MKFLNQYKYETPKKLIYKDTFYTIIYFILNIYYKRITVLPENLRKFRNNKIIYFSDFFYYFSKNIFIKRPELIFIILFKDFENGKGIIIIIIS